MALSIVIADSSDHGNLGDQTLFPVFSASDLFHEVNQSVFISPTPKLTIIIIFHILLLESWAVGLPPTRMEKPWERGCVLSSGMVFCRHSVDAAGPRC